uniref:Ubiquitin carboxyl-terminal hydrolase n=1 Tax=Sus scrofa TaxID=9823 RepID=A0A8D1UNK0_PIG
MAALVAHGFVQIWSRKTGMSKSKEAFIQTVERKSKVRLVVYFRTGEHTTFRLSNNIKSVVLRSYGKKQNHVHLTFQDNSFLFIEKLSSRDAENLKAFLDRVHENNLQPPIRPDRDGSVFASTAVRKPVNKTSFHKTCKKSGSPSFEKGGKNETPDLEKMPLFASKSSTLTWEELLENGYGKRKKMLSSGSEMNRNFLKENIFVRKKRSKTNPFRHASHKERKESRLKQNKKLEFGPSFKISSTGKPYLDGVGLLQMLTKNIYLAFLSESKYGEDDPDWDKLKMTLDFYPEKLWQGFPNLGNTCYMNAVLQSLFSIPSFADDLLSQGFPWGKIPLDALNMCLAQLLVLKDIYNIKIKERLLVNIKKAISAVAEIFSDNIQNDAHEFLGQCLDQMKENMGQLNSIWETTFESEQGDSPQQVLTGSTATEMLVCPVITNFEFELLCSIVCKACGQVVLKTEVSNYLSINLPQGTEALPLSIQSSFDHFFGAEELEYQCEKCKHRGSVAVHKFGRLPRVLIVHLKRYSFNEFWSLKKDDQEVIISKYLKLSSHCSESTKPPLPLSKNAHIREFQILKIFQRINSEIFGLSTPSAEPTSESKDSLAAHIGSEKEAESQKYQILDKGLSGEQQKDLGKSTPNVMDSTLLNSGDGAAIARELLAVSLMMDLEDNFLSPKGKPTSSTCQEVPENPKLKKCKRSNMFVDLEGVTETIKHVCKDKPSRISEVFHQESEQAQQYERLRLYEQALWLALLQSLPKPGARYTKNPRRPTEVHFQGTDVNSLGALGSDKNPGNKKCLDRKTEPETKKPKRNAEMEDPHAYRLIGVVSHLGKTPNSGHYISDAYDFERQVWFTYNDLQVSSIQEAPMQEARLCTGYIFFYMHNEIFEELLEREENSQPHSTEAGKTPRE